MITDKAALGDLDKYIKEYKDPENTDVDGVVAIIKSLKMVIKFLSTMRSNQLLTEERKNAIQAEKDRKRKEKEAKA